MLAAKLYYSITDGITPSSYILKLAENPAAVGNRIQGHWLVLGFQFSQIGDIYHFMDLIFTDVHCPLYIVQSCLFHGFNIHD